MKTFLYILVGIIALIIGGALWFYFAFIKIPSVDLSSKMSTTEKIKEVDQWLSRLHKKNKFNGAILYVKDGQEVFSNAYGYADHTKATELTVNSSFRLASVSKQFTAAGIMLLVEKGAIAYDDLVSSYIEGFPYKDVTIRNLLNQVSGIPDMYMDLAKAKKSEIPLLTNEIALDLIIKEKREATSKPNEKYEYSNTNYIILARLVEIISGQSFEDYMQKELFQPLGMQNTRVWNLASKEPSFDNKTSDFRNLLGTSSEIQPSFIDGVAGDGALFSSVKDFIIWDKFWYENKLIGEDHLKEAFTKPVLNNGQTSNYGFGWVITENGMWHNGAWLGANTMIIRNTERKDCLVILDNSSNTHFQKIVSQLYPMIN